MTYPLTDPRLDPRVPDAREDFDDTPLSEPRCVWLPRVPGKPRQLKRV